MNLYLPKIIIFTFFFLVSSCSNEQAQELVTSDQDISIIKFYFESGRYHDVLTEIAALSDSDRNDPELRYVLARTYNQIGQADRSYELLKSIKSEGHEFEDIDLQIIESLYQQSKIREAKNLLQSNQVQEKYSSDPEVVLLRAKIELAENNLETSKSLFLTINKESENYPQAQLWLARIDLIENKVANAVGRLNNLLENDQGLIEAWLLLADIKFKTAEYLDAENYYLKALRLDNSKILSQKSLQIVQNIVQSKTALGNAADAQKFYQSYLESYPKSPIYYYELARLAYSKKQYKDAEHNLRELLKLDKNNLRVILFLAKALVKQDKLSEANALLQQNVPGESSNLEFITLKAMVNAEFDSYKSVAHELASDLSNNSNAYAVLLPLQAYMYLKSDDAKKYSEILSTYDIEELNNVQNIRNIIALYLEMDRQVEAENFIQQLVKYYPGSSHMKILYMGVLNDIGKKNDIPEKIKIWLSKDPKNTALILFDINYEIEIKKYASAIDKFKSIDVENISENDENLVAESIKKLVLRTRVQKEHDKSLNLLERWQQRLVNNYKLKLLLADIYITKKIYNKAIPLYESLLHQYPENFVILNNLAWCYFNVKDGRALEVAEKAYKLNPYDAATADTYGWLLFRSGEKEKGLQLIESALEMMPDNAEIQEHYTYAKNSLEQ